MVERARARIGHTRSSGPQRVEAGHVRRWCEAIGDHNPRWEREAPPTFLAAMGAETLELPEALAYGRGWLNGGDRFEHREPVLIGDLLSSEMKLVDVYEKQGASGSLLFIVTETTFLNQHGRVVATVRGTRIRR